MNLYTDLGLLFLRVSTSLIMILAHGLPKLMNPDPFIEHIASNGFPMPFAMAYASIAAETLFPLLIVLGFLTRISALVAAGNMFVAAFVFHLMLKADPFANWEKAVIYMIIFITILIAGPGKFSVKTFLGR